MKKSVSYRILLEEILKDRKEAIGYLNTMLQESIKGDKESRQLFLIGLKNVIDAWKMESKIAKKIGISTEQLHKILSPKKFPKWHVIIELITALEIKITLG